MWYLCKRSDESNEKISFNFKKSAFADQDKRGGWNLICCIIADAYQCIQAYNT